MTVDNLKMWCLELAVQVCGDPDHALESAEAFYQFIQVPEQEGERVH